MCTVLSLLYFLCEKTATTGSEDQDLAASGARVHDGSTDVKMRRVNRACVYFGTVEEDSGSAKTALKQC